MLVITNLRAGTLRLAAGVTLHSGHNDVDEKAWAACRASPITAHYLARNEIRVQTNPTGRVRDGGDPLTPSPPVTDEPPAAVPETAPDPEIPDFVTESLDVSAMRAKDAISAINRCSDLTALDVLLHSEARSTVVTAIERRVTELVGGRA